MMDRDQYARLRELFHELCDRPPEDRSVSLDRVGAADPELHAALRSLLQNDARASETFLTDNQPIPEQIGEYRIIRKLADGGMGTIYEAEQQTPHRVVALKVVRPAVATPRMLRRFEYESHILGLLHHVGIAQIHDAGVAQTDAGLRPYFAMEMIRGRPLMDFAREHTLGVRDRLELLARVCDAVHHAHQRGVIHRDLKPSNVLVVKEDGGVRVGQPKVVDFGIARATDLDVAMTSMQTDVGQLFGTLPYMSPEQASGALDEIDTRSDVYALGVLGYELLTTHLPYEIDCRRLLVSVQAIQEQSPTPLSQHDRSLRGDIETIFQKALEKDKARRYDSAAALAADIRRSLGNEPIIARSPSAVYHLIKYARRNKGVVAAASTALLLLILGVVGTTGGVVYAVSQANEASTAFAEAEAVTAFLTKMFGSVNPDQLGRDVLVRDMLDHSVTRVDLSLGGQPKLEARLRHTIGIAYADVGAFRSAIVQLEEAHRLRHRMLGAWDPLTLESAHSLALAYIHQSQFDSAELTLRRAIRGLRRRSGIDHAKALHATNSLAQVYWATGKNDSARKLLLGIIERDVSDPDGQMEIRRARLYLVRAYISLGDLDNASDVLADLITGEDSHTDEGFRLSVQTEHYFLLRDSGRYREALAVAEESAVRAASHYGENHPATSSFLNNLALLYVDLDRFEDAETVLERIISSQTLHLGRNHISTITSINNLALLCYNSSRHERAERLWRETLELLLQNLGPEHPHTLVNRNNLAFLYVTQRRYGEGEEQLRIILDVRERVLGTHHPETNKTRAGLGSNCSAQGRYREAMEWLELALREGRLALGHDHVRIAEWQRMYAVPLMSLGYFEYAEEVLIHSHCVIEDTYGQNHSSTQRAVRRLIELYEAMDKRKEAAIYRAMLDNSPENASTEAATTVADSGEP